MERDTLLYVQCLEIQYANKNTTKALYEGVMQTGTTNVHDPVVKQKCLC